jgi:hypothetical protein
MKLALVLTLILSLFPLAEPFRAYPATMREIRTEIASRKKATDDKSVKSILSKLPCDLRRAIERRIQVNGFLLNHRFSTVLISGQEYTDAMNLRYGGSLETFSHIVTAVASVQLCLNAR